MTLRIGGIGIHERLQQGFQPHSGAYRFPYQHGVMMPKQPIKIPSRPAATQSLNQQDKNQMTAGAQEVRTSRIESRLQRPPRILFSINAVSKPNNPMPIPRGINHGMTMFINPPARHRGLQAEGAKPFHLNGMGRGPRGASPEAQDFGERSDAPASVELRRSKRGQSPVVRYQECIKKDHALSL